MAVLPITKCSQQNIENYLDVRRQKIHSQAYTTSHEESWRQHSLTKRRLRSNLIAAYSFLKDRCKNAEPNSPRLWQMAQQEAIATNCGLGISGCMYIMRNFTRNVVQHWNRLPMVDVDTPGNFQDLAIQTHGWLNLVLGIVILWGGGWKMCCSDVPWKQHFYDSVWCDSVILPP